MESLLKQVSYFMRWLDYMPEQISREGKVLDSRILNELSYPYFRVQHRMKGGKNA